MMSETDTGPIDIVRTLARDPFDPLLTADPIGVGRLLLETALVEGTTERSLLHAHVPGMHSIMLFDRQQTGAGKIRLFYTEEDAHPLNRFYDPLQDYNCRPHDHQFPIAIVPLVGNLLHMQTEEANHATRFELHKFIFTSAVGNQNFGLDYAGVQPLQLPDMDMLVPGDVEQLVSHDIHSVTDFEMGNKSTTAWIVVEGPEEQKPSLLFSPKPKPVMDASGLYVPAAREHIERVITHSLRLMAEG